MTQVIRTNISGSNQTAVAGSTATAFFNAWTNANGWVATVELNITGVGVSTEKSNGYYRREVFKWTAGAALPAAVGALVANTEIEEDASWDAHIALTGNRFEVHTVGDAAEKVNWAWSGTMTFQKV